MKGHGAASPAGEISVSSRHGVCCVADPRQAEEHAMKKAVDPYVLSFDSESVRYRNQRHKHNRHHWMICLAKSPDKLVSWGHAPTHELAESEARKELADLLSGLAEGGHVSRQNNAVPSARN
jgi:hypothetical protein